MMCREQVGCPERSEIWPKRAGTDQFSNETAAGDDFVFLRGSNGEGHMKKTSFVKDTQQRLIGRRDALRQALAGDMSLLRAEHDESGGDEIDAAIATEQAEIRSQMLNFETRELAQIEHALEKIKLGRYGRCESCESAISAMRLKALPYATECIDCARRDERRSAGGDRYSPINRIASHRSDEQEMNADESYEEVN